MGLLPAPVSTPGDKLEAFTEPTEQNLLWLVVSNKTIRTSNLEGGLLWAPRSHCLPTCPAFVLCILNPRISSWYLEPQWSEMPYGSALHFCACALPLLLSWWRHLSLLPSHFYVPHVAPAPGSFGTWSGEGRYLPPWICITVSLPVHHKYLSGEAACPASCPCSSPGPQVLSPIFYLPASCPHEGYEPNPPPSNPWARSSSAAGPPLPQNILFQPQRCLVWAPHNRNLSQKTSFFFPRNWGMCSGARQQLPKRRICTSYFVLKLLLSHLFSSLKFVVKQKDGYICSWEYLAANAHPDYWRKFCEITAFLGFNSISKHMLWTVFTSSSTCLQRLKLSTIYLK